MGYNDGNWGVGAWLVMGSMMLIFWGLVIALVVWAVRSSRSGGQRSLPQGGSSAGADSLLAERYARGEIDEDEFLRRRDLLHSAGGPRSGGTSRA
jgi:putative membrane protein